MTKLIRYETARQALAEAHRFDEVKEIRDKAIAMAQYAKISSDHELSRLATEIRLRAERRLGELIAEMRKAGRLAKGGAEVGVGRGGNAGSVRDPHYAKPTLADQGINKALADRARKAAAMPADKYERKIVRQVAMADKAASATGKAAWSKTEFTGEYEWYTPGKYIEAARRVLGIIDLDPASSEVAQRVVRAKHFYSAEGDGLKHAWHGRVWLNPPFHRSLVADFVGKLVADFEAGNISAAILLTHNSTDTEWFQRAARVAAAICFTNGRIRFANADGIPTGPSQGQSFMYFGPDPIKFAAVFGEIGFVVPAPYRLADAEVVDFRRAGNKKDAMALD